MIEYFSIVCCFHIVYIRRIVRFQYIHQMFVITWLVFLLHVYLEIFHWLIESPFWCSEWTVRYKFWSEGQIHERSCNIVFLKLIL